MLVGVEADGTARVHRNVRKHPAVAVQALLVGQVLDVDQAFAVLDAGVPAGAVFRQCVHGVILLLDWPPLRQRRRNDRIDTINIAF